MRIIAPITVTDSVLVSSSVPETDHPAWSSSTTYAAGQKVIRTTTHRIYEALDSTTGDVPESSPTKWLDIGPTNRWGMFDQRVGTATTATDSIVVELSTGGVIPAVALLETNAKEVTVAVSSPGEGTVYSRTTELQAPPTDSSWWHYFFEPFYRRDSATYEDLPSYAGTTVTVTISGASGEAVSCGVCVIGELYQFHESVVHGAEIGIQDYSRKETDDFGRVAVVERAWAKRARWTVFVQSSAVDRVQRALAALRAKPAVYIGADRFDSMRLYGFYKDFRVVIDYPGYAECSLELEGLI